MARGATHVEMTPALSLRTAPFAAKQSLLTQVETGFLSLRSGQAGRWRSYEHRSRHCEARRLGHGTATPATSQRGGGLAVVVSDFVESGDYHAPARGASARNDWVGCHSRLSCALHHGSTRNDAFKCVCPDSSLAFTRGQVVNDRSACSSHRKDPWGFPQPQGSGLRFD